MINVPKNLLAQLPKEVKAYKISSILPERFRQKGWPKVSHEALAIRFQNAKETTDQGVVLMDPNFDIPVAIICKKDGTPFHVDMKDKGEWTYALRGERIICWKSRVLSEEPNMIYSLKEYVNPASVGVKPMIATDQRVSLVSRTDRGVHLAHLNVIFKNQHVSSSVNYKRNEPIPFNDFVTRKIEFNNNFAKLLMLDRNGLNASIRKVIHNVDILNTLREQYLELVENSSRKSEFIWD